MKKTSKKIIVISIIAIVGISSAFATRIGITYNNTDYILNTTRPIKNSNIGYFSGMYDGFACVAEGKTLSEIYDIIKNKVFNDLQTPEEMAQAKEEYVEAFYDFMTNYTYGPSGNFKDIYPKYQKAITGTFNLKNARTVVKYADAEFYLSMEF